MKKKTAGLLVSGFVILLTAYRQAPVTMLLPGDRTLVSKSVGEDSTVLKVAVVDAAGKSRDYGMSSLVERPVVAQKSQYLALRHGEYGRYVTDDTMVVTRTGLIPRSETLVMPGSRSVFSYEGNRVVATVQKGDSAAVTREYTYPQAVFAFNQMESIVRSLPYKTGYTRVVPLFSEGDNVLEYDTISVIGKEKTQSGDAWKVRFADPVIIMHLMIDPKTRQVLSQEVTNRKSGGRMVSTRVNNSSH